MADAIVQLADDLLRFGRTHAAIEPSWLGRSSSTIALQAKLQDSLARLIRAKRAAARPTELQGIASEIEGVLLLYQTVSEMTAQEVTGYIERLYNVIEE